MARPRLGKHDAVFPTGYSKMMNPVVRAAFRVAWQAALSSRRLRALGFALPRSRIRSLFVGGYYWWVVDAFNREDFQVIHHAVTPEATLAMFGSLGTHRGPRQWESAIRDWQGTFSGLHTEMTEFINPPATNTVLACFRATGEGRGSAAGVEFKPTLVMTIERGMATDGAFYEDKRAALRAIGLAAS